MILIFVVFAIGSVPWLLALSKRFGLMIAVPGTAAAGILLAMAVLLLTHAARLDIAVSETLAALGFAAIGSAVIRRTPGAVRRPGRHAVALWVSPILGALGWIGTQVAAQVVPGAARLSWAMNGDGFNNLFYAHAILNAHGLVLGNSQNPVPLPASLLALVLAPGRSLLAARDLLGHDLASLTLVWTLILAATCIVTGAVVASAIPPRYPRAVAVASALGSLLPLTWYVAGLPIQWGYFNAHVILPLMLGAWLVFLASRRFPVAALVVLSAITTLTLASWAPLVLVPGSLGLAILVRDWARIRVVRGSAVLWLALGAAQVLAWLGIVSVPTFLSQGAALDAPGHGFPSAWPALPFLLVALLAVAVAVRRTTSLPVLPGTIAVVGAALAASAVLLLLDSSQDDPWSAYYPTKLAWLLSVFLIILTVSLAATAVVAAVPGRRTTVAGVAGVTVLVLVLAAAMPLDGWSQTVLRQPTVRILTGSIWHTGDRAAQKILSLTDPSDTGILWQSADPDEAMIDFWVMVTRGGSLSGNPDLRGIAFVAYRSYRATGTYNDSDVATLCAILTLMKPTPTVHTANPLLGDALGRSCVGVKARVIVDGAAR